MNKNFPKIFIFIFLILINVASYAQRTNSNHTHVNGYYRSNGTYVKSHNRTSPNSTNRDNFSTIGNTNPYTGQLGVITPDNKPLIENNSSTFDYLLNSPSSKSTEKPKNEIDKFLEKITTDKNNNPNVNSIFDSYKNPSNTTNSFIMPSPSDYNYLPTFNVYATTSTSTNSNSTTNRAINYYNRYSFNDKLKIEKNLDKLGYDVGYVDGVIDETTIEAIKEFQHSNDLTVDGKAGENTLKKLFNLYKKRNNILNIDEQDLSSGNFKNSNDNQDLAITSNRINIDDSNLDLSNNQDFKELPTIVINDCSLRNEPNAISNVKLNVSKGQIINIIGYESNYWKVKCKGNIGFINDMFIEVTNEMNEVKHRTYEAKNKKISETQHYIQDYNLHPEDYEVATLKGRAQLRIGADVITDIIVEVPVYNTIKIIGFKNSYWKVYYDGYIGYINEMFVNENNNMKRFKK